MVKIAFISSMDTVFAQIAECLLNADAAGIATAKSFGVLAQDGEELPFEALKALWLRGVETEDCVSRAFSDEVLTDYDLVIALNKQIKFLLPKSDKILTVGDINDGQEFNFKPCFEIGEYLDACYTVDKFAQKLVEKIKNGELL